MSANRVLVVDDEPGIVEVLTTYVEAAGFAVGTAASCAEVRSRLQEPEWSAILLDVGLPDGDGVELTREIRRTRDVPIILVTARAEELDTLLGLGVGADDYITKPFSPREVVARLHTVLRRTRGGVERDTEESMDFEGIRISRENREVWVAGIPAELSALDFDLLLALAAQPRRVFSRTQLLQSVWGHDFYGDERVVDVHIRTLRKALGDDATTPAIIGTVRGVGYRFLPARTP